MMHYFILFGLSAIASVLAAFVWSAQRHSSVHRWFAIHSLAISVWVLGIAAVFVFDNRDFWAGVAFAGAAYVPPAFLAFTRSYPNPTGSPSNGLVFATFTLATLLAIIATGTPWIVRDVNVTSAVISRTSGPLYPLFAAYFIATWALALALFYRKWRSARGATRGQLQYLGVGVVISGLGGTSSNLLFPLLTGRSQYSWLGPYFVLVLVAMTAHAIIRHRLMDLRLFIHRGLTIAIATILSFAPIALLLSLLWAKLSLHFSSDELFALLAATFVMTLLVPPTRDLAKWLLDRYLYRTHANYRRTVRDASKALTRVLNLRSLLAFISKTVATSTGVEGVIIYLRDEDGAYKAVTTQHHPGTSMEIPEEAPPRVLQKVDLDREPVVADNCVEPAQHDLHHELLRLDWALVLPVVSEDTVIAAIVLGPKLSGDPFYPQDLDLLMTLANQAGIAIKNAQLYAAVVLANEYIENIIATIESGVVAVNAAGQVAMFNRAAEQLTDLQGDQVKRQPATVLPSCLSGPLLATVADGQLRTQPEMDLPHANGSRPVICTTSPLREPAGTVLGAVAVFSDLTPLKELEMERHRAERLAYFEVLASGIAHEIKNPLVAIKTFTQLLPRRRGDEKFTAEFGRIAAREIDRMERMVNRLRTLSRPGERPRYPLDVRAPIVEAVEFLQASLDEKQMTVTSALGDMPAVVLGDQGELEELFLNLLMNAQEASPPGGALEVGIARTESQVAVSVADRGPGVPAELLDRIFEPFFTTKQHGSGLGLAICAGIAKTHGARLRAANRPEGGSVFTVELPLASAAPVRA